MPFSVGNVEKVRTTKNAFLARFGVHFFWAIFDYKTREILKCLAEMWAANRSNAIYVYSFCFFFLFWVCVCVCDTVCPVTLMLRSGQEPSYWPFLEHPCERRQLEQQEKQAQLPSDSK